MRPAPGNSIDLTGEGHGTIGLHCQLSLNGGWDLRVNPVTSRSDAETAISRSKQ